MRYGAVHLHPLRSPQGGGLSGASAGARPEGGEEPWSTAFARRIIQARSRRNEMIGFDGFGDPAWDILLEMFVARSEGRPMLIKHACLASQTPMTTAMRWIDRIEEAGLIERARDRKDARRVLLTLTDHAVQRIEHWFAMLDR